MKQPVLVLDGHLKSALAIVRSLGARGIPVWCAGVRGTAMALHSRYTMQQFTYTDPKLDRDAFVNELVDFIELHGEQPVIYTCSDATTTVLYEERERLSKIAALLFPPPASFELAFDKGATYSEALVHGVPAVKTFIRERKEEVASIAKDLSFPAVVKTRHSIVYRDGVGYSGTANFVMNTEELLSVFRDLYGGSGEAPLIQPFMQGEEYGVEMLVRDGHIHAETIHHRIRSLSPTGGASVVKETLEESELTEKLRRHAYTLAQALTWTGPLMVEFKVDPDTREPKLMELNGRWWGSLPLAIAADVDFPYLYYQLATGTTLSTEIVRAKPNVVTRHFLGDVRHVLHVWFSRDPMRPLLYPGRRKALRDFLSAFRGVRSDVWSWKDPKPAVMEYIDVVAKMFS